MPVCYRILAILQQVQAIFYPKLTDVISVQTTLTIFVLFSSKCLASMSESQLVIHLYIFISILTRFNTNLSPFTFLIVSFILTIVSVI